LLLLLALAVPSAAPIQAQKVTPAPAVLVSPAPGTRLVGSAITFVASAGSQVISRGLLVGSSRGASDLFSGQLSAQGSVDITDLPTDGRAIHVRLASQLETGWRFEDYVFLSTTSGSKEPDGVKADLLTPGPDSTLEGPAVNFTWTQGEQAKRYAIMVGTRVGANDLFQHVGSASSASAPNLPSDGSTLHVRLASLLPSGWRFNDYTLTAAAPTTDIATVKATLESPVPGSTLSSPVGTFTASQGNGVLAYGLWLGSTPGSSDLFNGTLGDDRTARVSNLPTDGSTIHLRLHSRFATGWQSIDYTLTSATVAGAQRPTKSVLIDPVSGSTLVGGTVTFLASEGAGVRARGLIVGTSRGGGDLFRGALDENHAAVVTELPNDGSTVFVRVASQLASGWRFSDHRFTAATEIVVIPANAELLLPEPGSTLDADSAAFTWSAGTSVERYSLRVGTTLGGFDLFQTTGQALSAEVSNLPTDGSTLFVRLTSLFAEGDSFVNYTFKATTVEEIVEPPADVLITIDETIGVLGAQEGPDPNTLPPALITVGETVGITGAPGTVATPLPPTLTISVDESVSIAGDAGATAPAPLPEITITISEFLGVSSAPGTTKSIAAQLLSPPPGSRLHSDTATFTWTAAAGADLYALSIGSFKGGANLFASAGQELSAEATGLPGDGSAIYVRLATLFGSSWNIVDYTFTAEEIKAQLRSPVPGTTLSGSTAEFTWSPGKGATFYSLSIGSRLGGSDIFGVSGGMTSVNVSKLPTDGSTIFIRLASFHPSGVKITDYTLISGP
jgi:hypothetical protein